MYAAFAGVAVTPENRLMLLHVGFTKLAWWTVPVAALSLGLASSHNAFLPQRAALPWFGMAVLLGAYAILLNFGPDAVQPFGLLVQVVAPKAATVVLIVALLVAAGEIDQATSG